MTKQVPLNLHIDTTNIIGDIDLTSYSLGQGGLSSKPMIDAHIPQLQQLHPKTIRFFIQEYFNLYPKKGEYNWKTLDKTLDAIVATGAKPIPAIVFKPKPLFPKIDQTIVHPTSYAEWEEIIYQLVKHCKEKNYGIKYWEIGNEVDIGEHGGTPYLFKPEDYLIFYKHTSDAILKADPSAKIGGPALCNSKHPIGDALIKYCAEGNAPLDFFSFHIYNSNPNFFKDIIRFIKKEKLGAYPQLKNTKIMVTEWNMSIFNHTLDPNFQPAFILEVTKIFYEEKVLSTAYYQIRDFFVDENEFNKFLSKNSTSAVMDMFNIMPVFGIFDNHGRVRPSYFVFKSLSQQKGKQLEVKGTNEDVKSFTTKAGNWIYTIIWNFPLNGQGKTYKCKVTYKNIKKGRFRVLRINPENTLYNVEELRAGEIKELKENPITITLAPYNIKWILLSLF